MIKVSADEYRNVHVDWYTQEKTETTAAFKRVLVLSDKPRVGIVLIHYVEVHIAPRSLMLRLTADTVKRTTSD